ncbi:DHA2 family efflux MFS transporter permease subunit [Lachnospiraceae bacterium OttesenSCG-928-D06]|nr:DHA2 family efflux MFS transporter permease subunit [Lachnospiraceae bacterium OttesenSCG-928-D06]
MSIQEHKSQGMPLTARQRGMVFACLLAASVASSFQITALSTALPAIVRDLGIDFSAGQWLTSGFSLAMGIVMPLTAFLITRIPTRPLLLTSMGAILLGLVLCVIARGFSLMMFGRVLQACGNGMLTSITQVVVLTIFPSEKRGAMMGWYGLAVGAAPVIAPTLAGVLVDSFGWGMIFYAAIAMIALCLVWAFVVSSNMLETKVQAFDIQSFLLSALAFGGITLGIGNAAGQGLREPMAFVPLLAGVIAGLFFARRQLRLEQPFLELRVLRSRQYAISVAASMLLYLVMMGVSLLMPLYIQSVMGHSATLSGLVTLPGALCMAATSPFAGRILDRLGMKKLFVTGAVCLLLGTAGMVPIAGIISVWPAAILHAVRCIAIGCLLMPLVTWGMSSLTPDQTAHGTALVNSLRTIAGAIGAAVFTGIMTSVAKAAAATHGAGAQIYGVQIAFFVMSLVAAVLLILAVLGVKHQGENQFAR